MNVRPVTTQLSEPVRRRLGSNAIVDARVLLSDLNQSPELLTVITKNLTIAKSYFEGMPDCAAACAFIDAYMLFLYHYMIINNLPFQGLPSKQRLMQELQNLLPEPQQQADANLPTLEMLHQQIREGNDTVDAVRLLKAVYKDASARNLNMPFAEIKSKLDNAKNFAEAVTATNEICQLLENNTKSFSHNGALPASMQNNVVAMYLATAGRLAEFAEQVELALADGLTIMELAKGILARAKSIRAIEGIEELENSHIRVFTSSTLSQLAHRIDRSRTDIAALAATLYDIDAYRHLFDAKQLGKCDSLVTTAKIAMLELYALQIDDLRVMVSTNQAVTSDEIKCLLDAYQIYMLESKNLYAKFQTATQRTAHADRLCEYLDFLLKLHATVSRSEYYSLFISVMSYTQEQISSLIGEHVDPDAMYGDDNTSRVLPWLYVKTKCTYTMACATENFEEYNSLLDTVERSMTDYLSMIAQSATAAELNSAHHQAILRLHAELHHQVHPARRLNKMLAAFANDAPSDDRVLQLEEMLDVYSSMTEVHQRLVYPPVSVARLHAAIGDVHLERNKAGVVPAMDAAIRCYKLAVLADTSDQATRGKLLAMLQAHLNTQRSPLLAVSLRRDISEFTAMQNSQAVSTAASSTVTAGDPSRQSTSQRFR